MTVTMTITMTKNKIQNQSFRYIVIYTIVLIFVKDQRWSGLLDQEPIDLETCKLIMEYAEDKNPVHQSHGDTALQKAMWAHRKGKTCIETIKF